MNRPVEQRPVHRRLQRVRESRRGAAGELARSHGIFDEIADAVVYRLGAGQRVTMEVGVGEIDLQKGQGVGDLLGR